jgi:hypothetical protein
MLALIVIGHSHTIHSRIRVQHKPQLLRGGFTQIDFSYLVGNFVDLVRIQIDSYLSRGHEANLELVLDRSLEFFS